jgi:hypothetical protein
MTNKLSSLGIEDYTQLMRSGAPMPLRKYKMSLWGVLFLILLLQAGLWITADSVSFSEPWLTPVSRAALCLTALPAVPLLVATPNKLLARCYRFSVVMLFGLVVFLQLTLVLFLTTLVVVANKQTALYVTTAASVLLYGVFLNVWAVMRGRRQLARGAYREDGGGFFNIKNKARNARALQLANILGKALLPWAFVLVSFSSVANNRVMREIRGPAPTYVQQVAAPLLILLVLLVVLSGCAGLTWRTYVMLHMNRRLGHQLRLVEDPGKRR